MAGFSFVRTLVRPPFGGSWMLGYTPNGLSSQKELEAVFGPASRGDHSEYEAGYTGEEFWFECVETKTVLKLYPRWGVYRVGGNDDELYDALCGWLEEKLNDACLLAQHEQEEGVAPVGHGDAVHATY